MHFRTLALSIGLLTWSTALVAQIIEIDFENDDLSDWQLVENKSNVSSHQIVGGDLDSTGNRVLEVEVDDIAGDGSSEWAASYYLPSANIGSYGLEFDLRMVNYSYNYMHAYIYSQSPDELGGEEFSGYALIFRPNTNEVWFLKYVNGALEELASATHSFSSSVTYRVSVENEDSQFRITIDGSLVVDVHDDTYDSGMFALGTSNAGREDNRIVHYDNIIVTPHNGPPENVIEWTDSDGTTHYYQVVSTGEALTWHAANNAAKSSTHNGLQGHLVTFTSEEEHLAVYDAFGPELLHGKWIGLEQNPSEGEPADGWGWITGEDLEYLNWGGGEPNNINPNEDVGQLTIHASSTVGWNDAPADALNDGYVLEFHAPISANVVYAEDFSEDPGFTSYAPDFAYWDATEEIYYVETYRNDREKYWAHTPELPIINTTEIETVRVDLYYDTLDDITYPAIRFYPSKPTESSSLDNVYGLNFSVYNCCGEPDRFQVSNSEFQIISSRIQKETWYTVEITYRDDFLVDVLVTERETGTVVIDVRDQPYIDETYHYIGIGYYTPASDLLTESPIRVDNILVTTRTETKTDSGLVAYYPLNNDAQDHSGNNLHGLMLGKVETTGDRCGRADSAFQFNGSDSRIDLGASSLLNPIEELSISVWVQRDVTSDSSGDVVSKFRGNSGTYLDDSYILSQYDGGTIAFEVRNNTGPNPPGALSEALSYGWHHVTAVYANDSIQLYVDGELVDQIDEGIPQQILDDVTLPTMIGASFAENELGFENVYKGKIDEVRLYNRAITQNEVDELASLGCGADIDFDGDRNADVLLHDNLTNRWYINHLDGGVVLGETELETDGSAHIFQATGDADDDGSADVLLRDGDTGIWSLLLPSNASSEQSFLFNIPTDPEWQYVAFRDFDGDSASELLLRNTSTGTWNMYSVDKSQDEASVNLTKNLSWVPVAVADFSGDGRADVLMRNEDKNNWWLYALDGSSVKDSSGVAITSNSIWQPRGVGDFNGDGRYDVLMYNTETAIWWVYGLNGAKVVHSSRIYLTRNSLWSIAEFADFNSDGTTDVLMRNRDNGLWWLYQLDDYYIGLDGRLDIERGLEWQVSRIDDFEASSGIELLMYNREGDWLMYGLTGHSILSEEVTQLPDSPSLRIPKENGLLGDKVAPIIVLTSSELFVVQVGERFIDPGASATDDTDGVVAVTVTGSVDTRFPGDYLLEYSAVDSNNNKTSITRTVRVQARQRRVDVSLFGNGTVNVAQSSINCANDRSCYVMAEDGTELTITASPDQGWEFRGWQNCTTVTDETCTLVVSDDLLLDVTFASSEPVVWKNDVVAFPEDTIRAIRDYNSETGTLTLEANTDYSDFEIGDIVISQGIFNSTDDPDNVEVYFARRVKQIIELSGSPIIIDTSEVSLDDIVESGSIVVDSTLTAQSVDLSSLPVGVKVVPAAARRMSASPHSSSIDIIPLEVDIVVFDEDGDTNTKEDQISVIGTIDLSVDPDINLDFGIFDGLREFRAVFRAEAEANLVVSIGGSLEISGGRWPIGGALRFAPIVAGPAVFIPEVQLYLGYSVSLDAAVEPGFVVAVEVEGGAHYLKSAGWQAVKSYDISAEAETGLEMVSTRLSVEAGPSVGLGLLLYGVVGPEVEAEAYGGFEAFPILDGSSSCTWDFNTYVGGAANFIGKFKLLSKSLAYEIELFKFKKVIDSASRGCTNALELFTPTSLENSDKTSSTVSLNWSYPEDSAAVSFTIYRDFGQIATGQLSTDFQDGPLLPDTEYCYFVVASDPQGESSEPSNALCVKTLAEDRTAPARPTGLAVSAVSSSALTLSWSESGDSDVVAYVVYGAGPGEDLTAQSQVAETEADLVTLLGDTEYCFEISALDRSGNESERSTQQCARTFEPELAEWTVFIGCQDLDWLIEEKMDLDLRYSSVVSVVGEGNDYGGTPLAYFLSANYDGETANLDGQIEWTFEGMTDRRLDEFVADLSSGDSGEVNMDQIERTGCDAKIRFVSESAEASGTDFRVNRRSATVEATIGPRN